MQRIQETESKEPIYIAQPNQTFTDREQEAAELGVTVERTKTNELILDLDGQAVVNMKVLDNINYMVVDTFETISRGGNRHMYIVLDNSRSLIDRICLQACLGSDPIKEVISLKRIWANCDEDSVSVLFETKGEQERLKAWRRRL